MATWYYAMGNDRQGPVEAKEVDRLIAASRISGDTLVWRDGLDGWEPAMRHFSFAVASPPPLDSAAPPPPIPVGRPVSDPNIGPDGLYIGAPSREFVEAAKVCLSKYATFSGRASRSEFWFFYLFWNLLMFAAQFIDFAIIFALIASDVPFFFPILTMIAVFGMILPQLAVSWRRLHDINRTGWWLGGVMIATFLFYAAIVAFAVASGITEGADEPPAAFVAVLGIFVIGMMAYSITIFIFYVTKGTLGPNRFG